MTENPELIETSFAGAIALIAASPELPEQKRRHFATSLRQIAKALGKPIEVIPARYSAVRADLIHLHQVPAGLTVKTLQNHKSNVKSALLWLAREKGIPEHGAPLSPDWEDQRTKVKNKVARMRLSSFMRYCSAHSISPAEVSEEAVDSFVRYRWRCGKPANDAFRRLLARAWNENVGTTPGWPARRLVVLPVKPLVEIEWSAFPQGLRQDIDRYLEGLNRIRRSRSGQRIRPLKLSTMRARRAELQAAARMAVKHGVAIDKLDSLSALLAPVVAEKVLDAYWKKNGENPKHFTVNLAGRFLGIAKETKCLTDADCERLDEMRWDLEELRQEGITEKNITFIREVLSPGVWSNVVNLPRMMMAEARQRQHAPVYKATGLRMTTHQFRHAAGAVILKHRPGEYELVRASRSPQRADHHQRLHRFGDHPRERDLQQTGRSSYG
jgi:hypothetical protein